MYDEMMKLDELSLQTFKQALEDYKTNVTAACGQMKTKIAHCSLSMKDPESVNYLSKANEVMDDVISTVAAAEETIKRIKLVLGIMALMNGNGQAQKTI